MHQTPIYCTLLHILYHLGSPLQAFKPWVDTLAPANQPELFQSAFFSPFPPYIFPLQPHPCSQSRTSTKYPELRIKHTILNNLHAGSLGCAPTPSQYFALAESSLMSFQRFPSPSIGALGIGSYVPCVLISLCPQPCHPFPLDLETEPLVQGSRMEQGGWGKHTKDFNRFAVSCCPVRRVS